MRTTIVLGVLAIAALLGGLPQILGGQMADAYHAALGQWLQPSVVSVQSRSYYRGWFQSTAQVELSLADSLCDEPPCPVLILNTVIHHGPLPIGATEALGGQLKVLRGAMISTIDLGPLFRKGRIEPGLPALEGLTKVYLNGHSSTRFEMPASGQTLRADSDAFSMTSDGLIGEVLTGSDDHMDGAFEMPRLEASSQSGRQALLEGITLGFDGKNSGSAFLGDWTASVDRIRYLDPESGKRYELDGLKMRNKSSLDGPLLSSALSFDLDRLSVPDYQLGTSHGTLRIENLHAQTVEALGQELQQVQRSRAQPALMGIAVLGLYQKYAGDLLSYRPRMALDELRVVSSDGVAELGISIEATGLQPSGSNIAEYLSMFEARLELLADEPVMRRWLDQPSRGEHGQIAALLERGLLQAQTNGQLRTEVAFVDGHLTVNGLPDDGFEGVLQLLKGRAPASQLGTDTIDPSLEPVPMP